MATPTDARTRPNHLPWPPMLLAMLIAAALVMERIWPLPMPPAEAPLGQVLVPIGALMLLAAFALDVAAIWTMYRARTNILPHRAADRLVTTGPFSWSRNPIYLANTALLGGLGLMLGNGWLLVAMAANAILV